jgi:apolipoprotein N-acyltransferase
MEAGEAMAMNTTVSTGRSVASTGPSPWHRLAGIVASAVLLGLYARGDHAWPLGFIALLPWLLVLDGERRLGGALLSGWAMSVAFVAAVLAWFGVAIGAYTGIGAPAATAVLLLLAPLLQPQLLVYAVLRVWLLRRHGRVLAALGAASAWVACEWLLPKLFGDTLGHGLQPSALLRQMADLGGAAGITFVLLLVNEALVLLVLRWRRGFAALAAPLACAVALVVAMAGYGLLRLHALSAALEQPVPTLRIGMVQANLTDYERRRAEVGAYAVVREALDTHYALSRAALEHHQVDALLWSETVYPTTFGHPRSEDGAALDREILDFVTELGVPLVFGTYDIDAAGEYNAAAFVEPGSGLLGSYRKTHPFPLTEHVPAWLDAPWLRRLLPWAGSWQAGDGARVFPLRTTDGREVNVLPLICLDDVRSALAIDGARLGAQAILGLSNDSWFTATPNGARLHLTVAAFRSIETRLPQIRVTTNGLSAIVDESGEVLVHTGMGDQAVLAGTIAARDPLPTLMLRWGDWVGRAALGFLLLLAALAGLRALGGRHPPSGHDATPALPYRIDVVALTPAWRMAAAVLRIAVVAGLLWLGLAMLWRHGLQVSSLAQLWLFAAAVVAPASAAWAIERAFAGHLHVDPNGLALELREARIEIPVTALITLRPWRLPLPRAGVDLVLADDLQPVRGILLARPGTLRQALVAAGTPLPEWDRRATAAARYAELRAVTPRRWFDQPLVKFALFPLLPALPAFRLHQHIAFGGTFGEAYTYGLQAWLTGLLIWWAAWAMGMVLFAALLRTVIEASTVLAWRWRPLQAPALRQALEWVGRIVFYAGVPAWLLLRILGS